MKTLLAILAMLAATNCRADTVTAYCPCARCCGKANQPTASGKMPTAGVTVAGPRRVPFGTVVEIEGVGRRVVQDRLAKRFDNRWDVFMPSHKAALIFGTRELKITVVKNVKKS